MVDKIDITIELPTEVAEKLCDDLKRMEEDRLKDIVLDLGMYIAYPFETNKLLRMYRPTLMSNIRDFVELNGRGIEVWREEQTDGRETSTILGPYAISWPEIQKFYRLGCDYGSGKLVIPKNNYEKLLALKNLKWENEDQWKDINYNILKNDL